MNGVLCPDFDNFAENYTNFKFVSREPISRGFKYVIRRDIIDTSVENL